MTNQRVVVVLALIAMLAAGMGADAAAPIHVCGKVTDYFVSDIASGGRIEIDGKNYPIASSASYPRTQPLPSVAIGSDICLDGTVDGAGLLLDFMVTSRASPSSVLPGGGSPPAPQNQASPAVPWLILLAAIVVIGAGVLATVMRRRA